MCVIEVKSTLNSSALEECHQNAASVKTVYSELKERDVLIGSFNLIDEMKSSFPIPYYIFAFDTDQIASNETITHLETKMIAIMIF